MNTTATRPKTCILGATGCVGFEMTTRLLQSGGEVLAVVRDKARLDEKLEARGLAADRRGLSVVEADLFAKGVLADTGLSKEIADCDYILNAASRPVSLIPWSRANREWGSIVSSLTKDIVQVVSESHGDPHVIVFCGPEYFHGYDHGISALQRILPKIFNSFVAAFQDNHDEALFLLASPYKRWSVLRLGSIRPASGDPGDASRIGMDLHKDRSDYRKGKGKALVAEDLAAYLAERIQSGDVSEFERQMPFLFNTQF